MLLWHIGYFELKVLEKAGARKALSSPTFYLKAGQKISYEKGRDNILVTRLEADTKMNSYEETYYNNPFLPLVSPTYFLVTASQLTAPSPSPSVLSHPHNFSFCLKRYISFGT